MQSAEFLLGLQETPLATWVRESDWGYPIVLTCHAIGMALVVGPVLAFDLRVLGYAKKIPLDWFAAPFAIAWCGFAINFVSGILLFITNASVFIGKWAFQVKLLLIVAAGIATWLLSARIAAEARLDAPGAISPPRHTRTALLSIAFWLGAIVAGRIIAYTD
jgi:hypothetical protein